VVSAPLPPLRAGGRALLLAVLAAGLVACGGPGSSGTGPVFDVTPDGVIPSNDNPCGDVPAGGRCVGGEIEMCATPTGSATPVPIRAPCHPDETCAPTPAGARCVLAATCYSGDAECRGARLATCEGGSWREQDCPSGCVASSLGAACRPSTQTTLYEGTLVYEVKGPNDQLSDWSPNVVEAPAQGFLVLSYADGVVVDATVTSASPGTEGRFSLQAVRPELVDGDDFLVALALRAAGDNRVAYLVADPGFGPGQHDVMRAPQAAETWTWSWTSAAIRSPALVRIPIEAGSGAAHVFDYLRFVYDFAEGFYGPRADAPLVVWLGFGANWNCGACFAPFPVMPFQGTPFSRQIWLPGGPDEAYWGGAVIAHELGHYVMGTYGMLPGEGGQHFIGIPSHPGLAWSEGFATWFSLVVRGSSIYFDKQQGGFFWFDVAQRHYESGVPWQRPVASQGLEQLIDENEVSAMLLGMTSEQTIGGLLGAIALPRMTRPPFARGYQRRAWDGLDSQGLPFPYWITQDSAPHVADYFDALLCHGVASPQLVNAVAEPSVHYPFPSQAPLCQHGRIPFEASVDVAPIQATPQLGRPIGRLSPVDAGAHAVTAKASIRWRVALEDALTARLALPPEVTLLGGPPEWRAEAGAAPDAVEVVWQLAGPPDALARAALLVDAEGGAWGYHARIPFTPATVAPIPRDGFEVRVGGRSFGRAVALPSASPETPRPRRLTLGVDDILPR